jgi:hypothetical protein
MNRSLSTLLKSASSPAIEEQMQALFHIAMLLEKSTRPSDENGFYETILPPGVLGIHLDEEAQTEILQELAQKTYSQSIVPSLFWAIGKSLPGAGAPVLVHFLDEHPDFLNDPQVAYQAVIALENCLDSERTGTAARHVEEKLRGLPVVRFLRQASSSPDEKLSEHATRLLRRLTRTPHGR